MRNIINQLVNKKLDSSKFSYFPFRFIFFYYESLKLSFLFFIIFRILYEKIIKNNPKTTDLSQVLNNLGILLKCVKMKKGKRKAHRYVTYYIFLNFHFKNFYSIIDIFKGGLDLVKVYREQGQQVVRESREEGFWCFLRIENWGIGSYR